MWKEIKRIIKDHSNFLLTTHLNPDGDGIGAATALSELLLQMGKRVHFVCDSPIPKKFQFLNLHGNHEVYNPICRYSDVEVIIVIDTNRLDRIGRIAKFIERPHLKVVCIDHHVPRSPFTPYTAIDPKACSSGAMIYTLYKECGFELTLNAATGIYASILCDTGRFSYSSTSRVAHKIADECIKVGVDPDLMYSRIYQQVTLAQFQVFAHVLENMETHYEGKVVLQQIYLEDYQKLGEQMDLEYIHEFTKLIDDVECVVLLQELPDKQVRVSARTKAGFDIERIMKSIGGGGHARAAGAQCAGSMEEIKTKILDILGQFAVKLR